MAQWCRPTTRPHRRRSGLDFEVRVDVGTEPPRRGLPGHLARPRSRCRDRRGLTTWPSVISRSWALASRSSAATSRTLAFSCRAPCRVTPPAIVADRLPPVKPEGDGVTVADDDADLLEGHAELVGGDLGEGGLVALPVRHLAGEQRRRCRLRPAEDAWTPGPARRPTSGRPRARGRLDEGGHADAQVAAPGPGRRPGGAGRREVHQLGEALQRLPGGDSGRADAR